MKIIKRSSEEQNFDREKIVNTIPKANRSIKEKRRILDRLINHISRIIKVYGNTFSRMLSVEEIQNRVKTELMKADTCDPVSLSSIQRFHQDF